MAEPIIVQQMTRVVATWYGETAKPTIGLDVLDVVERSTCDPAVSEITYSTSDRFIQRMAASMNYLDSFKVVIIDEIHERTIFGDIVSLLLKKYLKLWPALRVVLMSAAANFDLYREYFETRDMSAHDEFKERGPCIYKIGEQIFISHTMYEIKTIYIDEVKLEADGTVPVSIRGVFSAEEMNLLCDNKKNSDLLKYLEGVCDRTVPNSKLKYPSQYFHDTQLKVAVDIIKKLGNRQTNPVNTFLVFVDGPWDLNIMSMELRRRGPTDTSRDVVIRGIQAELDLEEQNTAFDKVDPNKIKVIVASNVGESSITLSDVDFVICLGTSMSQSVNSTSGIAEFLRTWISKDSAIQRRGRTGRVRPGTICRLYSQDVYDRMSDHTRPEIERSPLNDALLQLHSFFEYAPYYYGILPISYSMLDPPSEDKISLAYTYLLKVGFLHSPTTSSDLATVSCTSRLTSGGKFALELPCDCNYAKIIIQGILLGIGAEAIVIAAAVHMNERSPFSISRWANQYEEEYIKEFTSQSRRNLFALTNQQALDLGYFSDRTNHADSHIPAHQVDPKRCLLCHNH